MQKLCKMQPNQVKVCFKLFPSFCLTDEVFTREGVDITCNLVLYGSQEKV